ncbi:hypothetical protein NDU88_003893 [Pleurodeles waltl]|uniref:Uncharacterized protein n=1 Tax=Pleurodeles waltl TaxID=8319 RepID=A0AAV7W7F0_PLEWA|nr:hypothetical protein NDU88_003893 [Pleurodeles waltl]
MAMVMSGAEEATSGEAESSRFNSTTACLWMEQVLRRIHLRSLRPTLVGGSLAWRLVKVQFRQEKGPQVACGEAWRQAGERPVLRAQKVVVS